MPADEITASLLETTRTVVHDLIRRQASKIDETGEFPREIFQAFWETGLLNLNLPKEYGGTGASLYQICQVVEEISRVSPATALLIIVQSLTIQTILYAATEEQRRAILPAIAREGKLIAFGLTERSAGSDAAAIKTQVTPNGSGYLLNGNKNFVTFGTMADKYIVFSTTDPSLRAKGICVLLIDRNFPGIRVGPSLKGILGMRGTGINNIQFRNVPLESSCLLGEEGTGFKACMRAFDKSRVIIGAQAVGIAQGALDHALKHAQMRKQFGEPIGNLQSLQFMLADMATKVEACRCLVAETARRLASDPPDAGKYSSMAKMYASDIAVTVATDAMQILGSYGCFQGSIVERLYRDAKLTQIYEGTNQIQRLVIARHLLSKKEVKKEADRIPLPQEFLLHRVPSVIGKPR
ncbi:MAG: acyl-CoA dehydrogenase family protein [Candidatus Tectomicrobia bacterium]|uniref:Acyl-CoA dehydrogenase family protein n=1 Tax=Tectimicrobiota bacterium TaxID=2528274 RepID=A0A932GRE0_UNCTE|nr:acyl-CoA dehydrogenase family protein [Candidatus Tectomicrobia bacterium]